MCSYKVIRFNKKMFGYYALEPKLVKRIILFSHNKRAERKYLTINYVDITFE
jgi:hypothetical protein